MQMVADHGLNVVAVLECVVVVCGARSAQRPSSREQGLKAALGHARQSVRAANRTYSCAYHIAFVVDGHSECAPLVHDHRQNGARTVPVELQKRDRTDWGK